MANPSPRTRTLLRRLLWHVLAFLVAVSLIFFLPCFGLSGSTEITDSSNLSVADLAAVQHEYRKAFHLDEPIAFQYARFLGQTGSGDLGISEIHYPQKNAEFIGSALVSSLWVLLPAALVGIIVGFTQGALATFYPRTFGAFTRVWAWLCMLGFIPLLAYTDFSVLPIPAWRPTAALALIIWGYTITQTQQRLQKHFASPLHRFMQSLGIQPWRIHRRFVQSMILQGKHEFALRPLGILCMGSLLLELLFHYDGLAWLLLSAMNSHDTSMVRALVLTLVFLLILASFLVDSARSTDS